jgi:glycosyltransferase involved in cell wall biosynthesis
MKTLSVLLITPWSPTEIGGVAAAVGSMAREFSAQGHRVTILQGGAASEAERLADFEGVPVYSLYLRAPFRGRLIRSSIGSVARLRRTLRALGSFLEHKEIDVVAVQYPLPPMFDLALLRRRAPWRLVVTFQGNDAHDLAGGSWLDRRLVGLLVRRADGVTAVSTSLLEKVRGLVEVPEERTRVIPNGAPVDRIRATSGGNGTLPPGCALGVGHLIRRKGFDTVIRAVGVAASRGHRVPLVIAGDGPERADLQSLATECGVSDLVHFAGVRTPEEVLEYFQQCGFFVLGSREEGLPLVIAEAMASGRAVVATAVDGVPEIVKDGVTGLLVPVDDPNAMADVMIRVHEDVGLREALGAEGLRRAVAEFSWSAVCRRYTSFFEDAVSRSAA